ncbi:hypothetical protein ACFL1T_02445, partial [Chlamydiota bacterium]
LYYGSAKVIYQKSVSTTENIDGSESGSTTDMNNVYDKVGHLMEATGSGTSWSNSIGYIHYDGTATTPDTTTTIVSESTGTITQTYTVGYGKARIVESISEVSTTNNDGSIAYSEMTTTYEYGEFGLLISAHGSGYSTSNGYGYEYISEDGTGTIGPSIMNTTTANIDQSYAVIYGSAKVLDSHSISHTENADGTYSDTDMNTTYSYTWNGLVDGATGDGTTSTFSVGYTDDSLTTTAVISQSESTISQSYTVIVGQVKVWKSESDTTTTNVDESWSRNVFTTTNTYTLTGLLQESSGVGTMYSGDEFGQTTLGSATQEFEIRMGQARIIRSTSDTTTTGWDGSSVSAHSDVTYENSYYGNLIGADGTSSSISNDGWGNLTESTQTQTYAIYYGSAKVVRTDSTSTATNNDTSWSQTDMTVTNYYDSVGRITGATGTGTTQGIATGYIDDSSFDESNIMVTATTEGTIAQTYSLYYGSVKLKNSHSDSTTTNVDTSTAHTIMDVAYSYDMYGRMESADGSGTSWSTATGWTFDSDTSTMNYGVVSESITSIDQTYSVIRRQAKLISTENDSTTTILDSDDPSTRSWSTSHITTTYSYTIGDSLSVTGGFDEGTLYSVTMTTWGRLTGATGSGTTYSETFGHEYYDSTLTEGTLLVTSTSEGTIDQTYTIVNGQAKIERNDTVTTSYSADGSYSTSDMTMTYSYNGVHGLVEGAEGSGNSWNNTYGYSWDNATSSYGDKILIAETTSTITQTFRVRFGQAQNVSTYTESKTESIEYREETVDRPESGFTYSESWTYSTYDDTYGKLTEVSGTSQSVSVDYYGNTTTSQSDIHNLVYLGQAKQTVVETTSTTLNVDTSEAGSQVTTTYYYNNYGKALYGEGEGITWSTAVGFEYFDETMTVGDATISVISNSTGTINQEYAVYYDQFKVLESRSHSTTTNVDESQLVSDMITTYSYDLYGALNDAQGSGTSVAYAMGWSYDEALGVDVKVTVSDTTTTITQTFIIYAGQAKIKTSQNDSYTYVGDRSSENGVLSTTESETFTEYNYYDFDNTDTIFIGKLERVEGNVTATSHSHVWEFQDDTHSTLVGINETVSISKQTYDVHENTGKVLLLDAVTTSTTITEDGRDLEYISADTPTLDTLLLSTEVNPITPEPPAWQFGSTPSLMNQSVTYVEYSYDDTYGLVYGATGSGTSFSNSIGYEDDSNWNIVVLNNTTGTSSQSYIVKMGKSLVVETVTTTHTQNYDAALPSDQSYVDSVSTVENFYDAVGLQTSSSGMSHSETFAKGWTWHDGDPTPEFVTTSTTISDSTQDYRMYYGSAKLQEQVTSSVTEFPNDGIHIPESTSTSTMTYHYDEFGHVLAATGTATSISDDGWENTSDSTSTSDYSLYYGRVSIVRQETSSHTYNYDGSEATTDLITTYYNDEFGRVTSAVAEGTSWSNGFGYEYMDADTMVTAEATTTVTMTSTGTIQQTYVLHYGQVKVSTSLSETETENKDGSLSRSTMTTTYDYDEYGKLIGADGSGTSWSSVMGHSWIGWDTTDDLEFEPNSTWTTGTVEWNYGRGYLGYPEGTILAMLPDNTLTLIQGMLYNDGGVQWGMFDGAGTWSGDPFDGGGTWEATGVWEESLNPTGNEGTWSMEGTWDAEGWTMTGYYYDLSGTVLGEWNMEGDLAFDPSFMYHDTGLDLYPDGFTLWTGLGDYETTYENITPEYGDDPIQIGETTATIEQTYTVRYGQAKLLSSRAESDSYSGDTSLPGYEGIISYSTSDVTTTYSYTDYGHYVDGVCAVSEGTSAAYSIGWVDNELTLLAIINTTQGTVSQQYVAIHNRPVILSSTSSSTTTSFDDSQSGSDSTTTYSYDEVGRVIDAKGEGTIYGGDQYGMTTQGTTTQEYEVRMGAARLNQAKNDSTTTNWDGSTVSSHSDILYTNDVNGLFTFADGTLTSVVNDGWGNLTESEQDQIYVTYYGQTKVVRSDSTATSTSLDGSVAYSRTRTHTYYDEYGRTIGADSAGKTWSYPVGYAHIDDPLNPTSMAVVTVGESITESRQTYELYYGMVKVATALSETETENVDGSTGYSLMEIRYSYNEFGDFLDGKGTGYTSSNAVGWTIVEGDETGPGSWDYAPGEGFQAWNWSRDEWTEEDHWYIYNTSDDVAAGGTPWAPHPEYWHWAGTSTGYWKEVEEQTDLNNSLTMAGSSDLIPMPVYGWYNETTAAYDESMGYWTWVANGHWEQIEGSVFYEWVNDADGYWIQIENDTDLGEWVRIDTDLACGPGGCGTLVVSESSGVIYQDFDSYRNQPKIHTSQSNMTTSVFDSVSGELNSWSQVDTVMTYSYTGGPDGQLSDVNIGFDPDNLSSVTLTTWGRLTGADGSGLTNGGSIGWDYYTEGIPFGTPTLVVTGTSFGVMDQTYTVAGGQTKLDSSHAMSNFYNADGSFSYSDITTRYAYDDETGLLISASISPLEATTTSGTTNISADISMSNLPGVTAVTNQLWARDDFVSDEIAYYGNITESQLEQEFEVFLGQAKTVKSITQAHTENRDGSLIDSNSITYNEYGSLGLLIASTGENSSTSVDYYGNTTTVSGTSQSWIYMGSAKQKVSTSHSDTVNVDGSEASSDSTTTYQYDTYGKALFGMGSGSNSSNSLGFEYFDETMTVGDATISVISTSTGTFEQLYDVYYGSFRLAEAYSASQNHNADGSQGSSDMLVTYFYDTYGVLSDAVGDGTGWSQGVGWTSDSELGITGTVVVSETTSTIHQEYTVIDLQAKVEESVNQSYTYSGDPDAQDGVIAVSESTSTTKYFYDTATTSGLLIDVDGTVVSTSRSYDFTTTGEGQWEEEAGDWQWMDCQDGVCRTWVSYGAIDWTYTAPEMEGGTTTLGPRWDWEGTPPEGLVILTVVWYGDNIDLTDTTAVRFDKEYVTMFIDAQTGDVVQAWMWVEEGSWNVNTWERSDGGHWVDIELLGIQWTQVPSASCGPGGCDEEGFGPGYWEATNTTTPGAFAWKWVKPDGYWKEGTIIGWVEDPAIPHVGPGFWEEVSGEWVWNNQMYTGEGSWQFNPGVTQGSLPNWHPSWIPINFSGDDFYWEVAGTYQDNYGMTVTIYGWYDNTSGAFVEDPSAPCVDIPTCNEPLWEAGFWGWYPGGGWHNVSEDVWEWNQTSTGQWMLAGYDTIGEEWVPFTIHPETLPDCGPGGCLNGVWEEVDCTEEGCGESTPGGVWVWSPIPLIESIPGLENLECGDAGCWIDLTGALGYAATECGPGGCYIGGDDGGWLILFDGSVTWMPDTSEYSQGNWQAYYPNPPESYINWDWVEEGANWDMGYTMYSADDPTTTVLMYHFLTSGAIDEGTWVAEADYNGISVLRWESCCGPGGWVLGEDGQTWEWDSVQTVSTMSREYDPVSGEFIWVEQTTTLGPTEWRWDPVAQVFEPQVDSYEGNGQWVWDGGTQEWLWQPNNDPSEEGNWYYNDTFFPTGERLWIWGYSLPELGGLDPMITANEPFIPDEYMVDKGIWTWVSDGEGGGQWRDVSGYDVITSTIIYGERECGPGGCGTYPLYDVPQDCTDRILVEVNETTSTTYQTYLVHENTGKVLLIGSETFSHTEYRDGRDATYTTAETPTGAGVRLTTVVNDWDVDPDPTFSAVSSADSWSQITYAYDDFYGFATGGDGTGTSSGNTLGYTDGSLSLIDELSYSETMTSQQSYVVHMNRAVVKQSESETHSDNNDGSFVDSQSTVTYTYDVHGLVTGGTGQSHSQSTAYGLTTVDAELGTTTTVLIAETVSSATQTYLPYFGSAKVHKQISYSETTVPHDVGIIPENTSTSSLTYQYDTFGHLLTATGTGESFASDGWGNETVTETDSVYYGMFGRSVIKSSISESHTLNADGSEAATEIITTYDYDLFGRIIGGEAEGNTWGNEVWWEQTDDSSFEKTLSVARTSLGTLDNTYTVVNGQARLWIGTSDIHITDMDGAEGDSATETEYFYNEYGWALDARGTTHTIKNAVGYREVSYDDTIIEGIDVIATTESTSINQFLPYLGQMKVKEASSVSYTENRDSSYSLSNMLTKYTYNAFGHYLTASATGTSRSNATGFEDIDKINCYVREELGMLQYTVSVGSPVLVQAELEELYPESEGWDWDWFGAVPGTRILTIRDQFGEARVWWSEDMSIYIVFVTDKDGEIVEISETDSTITQTFIIINNTPRVKTVETESTTTDVIGSRSGSHTMTEYQYYTDYSDGVGIGLMVAGTGQAGVDDLIKTGTVHFASGTNWSQDDYGNTTTGTSDQVFYNYYNSAKVYEATTHSDTYNTINYSQSYSDMVTRYEYSSQGLAMGAEAIGSSWGNAYGWEYVASDMNTDLSTTVELSQTESDISQSFGVFDGTARVERVETTSTTTNNDALLEEDKTQAQSHMITTYSFCNDCSGYDAYFLRGGKATGTSLSYGTDQLNYRTSDSTTDITQFYTVIMGRTYIDTSYVNTFTQTHPDNSWSSQQIRTTYFYDDNARLTHAQALGFTQGETLGVIDSDDEDNLGVASYFQGFIGQTYVGGPTNNAQVVQVVNETDSYNRDGTGAHAYVSTSYTYDDHGFLIGTTGQGATYVDDCCPNVSTEIVQDVSITSVFPVSPLTVRDLLETNYPDGSGWTWHTELQMMMFTPADVPTELLAKYPIALWDWEQELVWMNFTAVDVLAELTIKYHPALGWDWVITGPLGSQQYMIYDAATSVLHASWNELQGNNYNALGNRYSIYDTSDPRVLYATWNEADSFYTGLGEVISIYEDATSNLVALWREIDGFYKEYTYSDPYEVTRGGTYEMFNGYWDIGAGVNATTDIDGGWIFNASNSSKSWLWFGPEGNYENEWHWVDPQVMEASQVTMQVPDGYTVQTYFEEIYPENEGWIWVELLGSIIIFDPDDVLMEDPIVSGIAQTDTYTLFVYGDPVILPPHWVYGNNAPSGNTPADFEVYWYWDQGAETWDYTTTIDSIDCGQADCTKGAWLWDANGTVISGEWVQNELGTGDWIEYQWNGSSWLEMDSEVLENCGPGGCIEFIEEETWGWVPEGSSFFQLVIPGGVSGIMYGEGPGVWTPTGDQDVPTEPGLQWDVVTSLFGDGGEWEYSGLGGWDYTGTSGDYWVQDSFIIDDWDTDEIHPDGRTWKGFYFGLDDFDPVLDPSGTADRGIWVWDPGGVWREPYGGSGLMSWHGYGEAEWVLLSYDSTDSVGENHYTVTDTTTIAPGGGTLVYNQTITVSAWVLAEDQTGVWGDGEDDGSGNYTSDNWGDWSNARRWEPGGYYLVYDDESETYNWEWRPGEVIIVPYAIADDEYNHFYYYIDQNTGQHVWVEDSCVEECGHLQTSFDMPATFPHWWTDEARSIITQSAETQTYEVYYGASKVDRVESISTSTGHDGVIVDTWGWTDYDYTEYGKLTSVDGANVSQSKLFDDPHTQTYTKYSISETDLDYTVLYGQAKVTSSYTETHSSSIGITNPNLLPGLGLYPDDASLEATSNTSFTYYDDSYAPTEAHKGLLRSMATSSDSTVYDAYGNRTDTNSNQVYKIIYGQGKVYETTSYSYADNVDETWAEVNLVVNYRYTDDGVLNEAWGDGTTTSITKEWDYVQNGQGTGSSNLAIASTTTGFFHQSYDVYCRYAVLAENDSTTHTDFVDGGYSDTNMVTWYDYDDPVYWTLVTGGTGSGETSAVEMGFTSNTAGDLLPGLVPISTAVTQLDQEFNIVVFGQAKLTQSETFTTTDLLNREERYDAESEWGIWCEGGWSETYMETNYFYDGVGLLNDAQSPVGWGQSSDGHGILGLRSMTYTTIENDYVIKEGKAVVFHSVAGSNTDQIDGIQTHSVTTTDYDIDGHGRVYGATVDIVHDPYQDQYGNSYSIYTQQNNDIYYGKARVYQTDTMTVVDMVDDAFSVSNIMVTNSYDSYGHLIGASGGGGYNPLLEAAYVGHELELYTIGYEPMPYGDIVLPGGIIIQNPWEKAGNWSDDGWFGTDGCNQTTSEISQTYHIKLGRAVLAHQHTETSFFNYDESGGTTVTDMWYDITDKGNYYDADSTAVTEANEVGYEYANSVIGATAVGPTSVAIIKSTVDSDYNVWFNRMKVASSDTESNTLTLNTDMNLTYTSNTSDSHMDYYYDMGNGLLDYATGSADFTGQEWVWVHETDGTTAESHSSGHIDQTFGEVIGKVKLLESTANTAITFNHGGYVETTDVTTYTKNEYDEFGKLLDEVGKNYSTSQSDTEVRYSGNLVSKSSVTSTQNLSVFFGKTRTADTQSTSYSENVLSDSKTTTSGMHLENKYDLRGRLTGAEELSGGGGVPGAGAVISGIDHFGNITIGHTDQVYEVRWGRAVPYRSVTYTKTTANEMLGLIPAWIEESAIQTVNSYDGYGRLSDVSASTIANFSPLVGGGVTLETGALSRAFGYFADGLVHMTSKTKSTITQEYDVFFGQAKIEDSFTTAVDGNVEAPDQTAEGGGIATGELSSATHYLYDSVGEIANVSGTNSSSMNGLLFAVDAGSGGTWHSNSTGNTTYEVLGDYDVARVHISHSDSTYDVIKNDGYRMTTTTNSNTTYGNYDSTLVLVLSESNPATGESTVHGLEYWGSVDNGYNEWYTGTATFSYDGSSRSWESATLASDLASLGFATNTINYSLDSSGRLKASDETQHTVYKNYAIPDDATAVELLFMTYIERTVNYVFGFANTHGDGWSSMITMDVASSDIGTSWSLDFWMHQTWDVGTNIASTYYNNYTIDGTSSEYQTYGDYGSYAPHDGHQTETLTHINGSWGPAAIDAEIFTEYLWSSNNDYGMDASGSQAPMWEDDLFVSLYDAAFANETTQISGDNLNEISHLDQSSSNHPFTVHYCITPSVGGQLWSEYYEIPWTKPGQDRPVWLTGPNDTGSGYSGPDGEFITVIIDFDFSMATFTWGEERKVSPDKGENKTPLEEANQQLGEGSAVEAIVKDTPLTRYNFDAGSYSKAANSNMNVVSTNPDRKALNSLSLAKGANLTGFAKIPETASVSDLSYKDTDATSGLLLWLRLLEKGKLGITGVVDYTKSFAGGLSVAISEEGEAAGYQRLVGMRGEETPPIAQLSFGRLSDVGESVTGLLPAGSLQGDEFVAPERGAALPVAEEFSDGRSGSGLFSPQGAGLARTLEKGGVEGIGDEGEPSFIDLARSDSARGIISPLGAVIDKDGGGALRSTRRVRQEGQIPRLLSGGMLQEREGIRILSGGGEEVLQVQGILEEGEGGSITPVIRGDEGGGFVPEGEGLLVLGGGKQIEEVGVRLALVPEEIPEGIVVSTRETGVGERVVVGGAPEDIRGEGEGEVRILRRGEEGVVPQFEGVTGVDGGVEGDILHELGRRGQPQGGAPRLGEPTGAGEPVVIGEAPTEPLQRGESLVVREEGEAVRVPVEEGVRGVRDVVVAVEGEGVEDIVTPRETEPVGVRVPVREETGVPQRVVVRGEGAPVVGGEAPTEPLQRGESLVVRE